MIRIRLAGSFLFSLVCLSAAPEAGGSDQAPGARLASPIVFARLPVEAAVTRGPGRAAGTLRADYGEGCQLVRREPDGTLRVLSADFAGACEPDVSFDGQRILFAGKRRAEESWNIWEISVDGGPARQLTQDAGNCRTPAYQATLYTIVSTEPWSQIMFVSDVAGALNEVGSGPATSLYSCKMDGSGLRRLSMNLSDDLDPLLLRDGRILCSSWQRMDLRRGPEGRVSIFALNADGADWALFCANSTTRIRHMLCETSTRELVFVEADRVGWDGAGRLAAVSMRRPFHSYRSITAEADGLFHSPAPLEDGTILVSRRPRDGGGAHAILRMDSSTGESTTILDDPAHHDFHARALVARARPDGRSSSVNEEIPNGKLYCLDAYLAQPPIREELAPGTVHAVRVIEGVPLSKEQQAELLASGSPGSSVHSLTPIAGRRLLGTAEVEEDGSFQLEVPADTPIQLQTLDEDGMALATCGWIWAKHREWRGCIGCHEDPELVPENRFTLAVQKPAVDLTPPPSARRSVTFQRDLMPILAAKCASCHDGTDARLNLSSAPDGPFNRAYLELLEPAQGGPRVTPGRARTSPLVWWLWQRNTSRPWDEESAVELERGTHPPPCVQRLSDEERATLIEWIDLGALWDDGFGPARQDVEEQEKGS